MKLRKIAAGLLAVAGSVLLIGSVIGCLGAVNQAATPVPQPEGVREFALEFLDTLDKGNFSGVEKCLYGAPDLGLDKEPDTETGKQLWQAYRDSVSVEYSDYCYSEGTNIYQSAKVTTLDLSAALAKLNSTAAGILKTTLETAEDPTALLNEDGTIPDALRQQALSQALTQVLGESSTVTREMNVRLVKQDGQWRVVPDGALLAVLSAGLELRRGSMGYKPKYAANSRKREPEVIRGPKPETKKPAKSPRKPRSRAGNIAWMVLTAVLVPLCTFAAVRILGQMVYTVGTPKEAAISKTKDMAVVDSLDDYAQEKIGEAQSVLAGLNTSDFTLPTQPETEPPHEHYTIPADAAAAPKPNQSLYGSVRKPEDMEPVLEQAKWVLDGQKTYFQLDQKLYDDSVVRYYLDETILAVTWQEVHDDSVYTFSEIKVEDASQFRRHLAGGEYGSNMQYLTTEMAETVNAVVASAGDFYRFREFGAVVYQGQARKVDGTYAETCYIDYNGDMHFTRAGEVLTTEAVQQYVDENNINFSLAFGPILVDNYELQNHTWYGVGEINEGYARAALCQMDSLHYLVVTANTTGVHQTIPTVAMFAKNIAATGCRMAYCLDGGQTATIVMNNELVNRPVYGQQRKISDIIYFATAVPEGGRTMDKVALYVSGTPIYWCSLALTLGAVVAICFFLAFYIGKSGNAAAGFAAVPVALVLSLVLARFFHWYCQTDSYKSFSAAMADFSGGGFALMGAFLGCTLAACLMRLVCLQRNLPEMLDAMSLGGCAGIVVGRLSALFNATDRGQVLANFRSLPIASPVSNAVSGAVEYRLATFALQSIATFVLFLILAVFYLRGQKRGKLRDGDTCLIFCMLYGCTQVVLDSTRYDSLFFRSNGFVSVVQVLGALGLALAVVVFARRMVKARGFRAWYIFLWLLIALVMTGAGYMEYYVQRRGNEALFAYSVMSACLLAASGLTLFMRSLAVKVEAKYRRTDDES